VRQEPNSSVIAVTGADGPIGKRVVQLLRATCGRVIEIDPGAPDPKRALEGVDVIIHLAFAVGAEADAASVGAQNVEAAMRVLDAAGAAGTSHVVLLSSAAVYGAWANNPVPLTEDAPVRPNPGFGFAAQKAEVERLAGEWVEQHPGATLTILRPAVPMGEDHAGFLSSALGVRAPVATGDPDVPVQFVHLDDLASAVVHAAVEQLDGVFNVAADGWLTASQARTLAGAPPRVRVPDRVRAVLARLGRTPAGAAPYTLHPWVVACDRLKATGWAPVHANDETIVETTEGMPWSRLSPQRKQELSLAGAALGIVGCTVGIVALVRRIRRRRAA
jgi:nucleoside-diphosphate-sugar epimerase